MEVNCSEEVQIKITQFETEPSHILFGEGYLYRLTEGGAGNPEFFGVQICNLEGNKILYALDDLSEDRTVAEELLKLLAVEQVEPDQATYIIEDYLGKISTIIH